jgi:hypothetical protein
MCQTANRPSLYIKRSLLRLSHLKLVHNFGILQCLLYFDRRDTATFLFKLTPEFLSISVCFRVLQIA